MVTRNIDKLANILWDYMRIGEEPKKSNVVLCLCSYDRRVADKAADLMLNGFGKYLLFSGGFGDLTKNVFKEPEARVFAKIAEKKGVYNSKILIEDKSSNTGQNITFSYNLICANKISYDSILLVQKPYMERRTYATFMKQWPGQPVALSVTSPNLSYEEYTSGDISKDQIINVMVGDLQRIKDYPKLGFQIEQQIPNHVLRAYEKLIELGFDKRLIKK